jgi:protein-S-isoprenylcysteine O-methyltransferase Ste14
LPDHLLIFCWEDPCHFCFVFASGYSGVLLHIFGVSMLYFVTFKHRTFATLALMGLACAALQIRVDAENAMLQHEFGNAWRHHSTSRWHVIPYIW